MHRTLALCLPVIGAGLLALGNPARACCSDSPASAAAAEAETVPTGAVCQIEVKGMTCGACANSVAKAAQAVPGVSSAQVDWKAGRAVIHYDPRQTNPKAIASAITKAGFPASSAEK